MPRAFQAWYSRDDLEMLADREAALSGEFRVSKLTRLEGLVHAERSGSVAATLATKRSTGGRLVVTLTLQGTLVVTCQRCLEPFDWYFDERMDWLVVGSDSEAERIGGDLSPLVMAEGRLGVEELIEDELIVALPMAPRHESIDDCGPLAQNLGARPSDATVEHVGGTRDV